MGDFGISRILENTYDCAKTAIGTPYYLSPEICNQLSYSFKSDIWSLGCVLYEMLTFKHPFEGENIRQLIENISKGKYSPVRNCSQLMKDLMRNMLTVKTESRFGISQVLAHKVF